MNNDSDWPIIVMETKLLCTWKLRIAWCQARDLSSTRSSAKCWVSGSDGSNRFPNTANCSLWSTGSGSPTRLCFLIIFVYLDRLFPSLIPLPLWFPIRRNFVAARGNGVMAFFNVWLGDSQVHGISYTLVHTPYVFIPRQTFLHAVLVEID